MIVYLFGATDADQLLKIPLLVTHYIKHKKESPYMTLGSFFKMHYIDPQPFDADYSQDMQLPFKTVRDMVCRNIPTDLTVLSRITFKPPVENPGIQPVINDDIPPHLMTYGIFQPPRI